MRPPRCDWCDGPDPDLTWRGGARFHEACWAKRVALLHECDDAATVRRLKGELARAQEDVEALTERLTYAEERIRALRAKLDKPLVQAAAPRET
jgi:hypothetical protein